MTVYETMAAVLRIFPQAQVGSDNDGQLVIYTGCRVDGDAVVTFTLLAMGADDE